MPTKNNEMNYGNIFTKNIHSLPIPICGMHPSNDEML